MNSIVFDLKKHSDLLSGWYSDWGQDVPPPWSYSKTGLIISNPDPICAGFLCKTDANFAIIYGYISDKNADKAKRKEALVFLSEELTKIAENDNFKMVVASSAKPTIVDVFKNLGYSAEKESTVNLGRILCRGWQ